VLLFQQFHYIIQNFIRDFSFSHEGEIFGFAVFFDNGGFISIRTEDAAFGRNIIGDDHIK